MARKLKTYITNLGFFELALAAPSMKAALEAWGMGHNAFHQGFARETHDPKIVVAAMARPGVVLRRPVGTKGAFAENAALPKQLWSVTPPKPEPAKAKTKPKAQKPKAHKPNKDEKADRAAILSFEKAKARRDRERQQQEAREEAKQERERAQRQRDAQKAEAALARAKQRHDEAMAAIEKERNKLDRRAALENERWDAEREDLKRDLRLAKD